MIAPKEFDKKSLKSTEINLSKFVVGERVDYFVLSYWKNKLEIVNCLKIVVFRTRQLLGNFCDKLFTFVDTTKFTIWNVKEVQIHIANKIARKTIYPAGVRFLKKTC